MNTDKKIEMLKQVELFRFFEESNLRELCENCTELALEKDEILFYEGTLDNTMYLILFGQLAIYKGIKRIAVLDPGKFLGEMSLIESKPRSATVKSLSEALLMEIDEFNFNKYLASKSHALVSMLQTLSGRIRSDLDLISSDMQKLNIFIHDMNNFLSLMELGSTYLEDVMQKFDSNRNDQGKKAELEKIKKALKLFNVSKEGFKELIDQSMNQAKHSEVSYKITKSKILTLVQETVHELDYHKNLKGKQVDVKVVGKIPEGYFNYMDIKRVLQNLLINAGYVTNKNGIIEVIVKRYKDNIIVSVIDEGCGISEEIRPFLLKHPITTKKEGNGLGLLSCKQIIENHHNGKFWFDSKKDKGTAFHFMIPIMQSQFY